MKDLRIGIIGGGAAGMACAITAARACAEVTIIEAGERMGQKILSTGNGKCNLGNMELDASQYHGNCA
ncbi:MAG: NAD(P)/FAD-dependent oxidoreductase, partial [Lachnospiraceae bacterium]|nr:NAD(P)/FAD-dependent oxidoreductase [Lachnospiraceae bacterium]